MAAIWSVLSELGDWCSGVAETGADCQHAPVEAISNVGQLAQTLHDRIIVHDDHRFAVADLGTCSRIPWEIESGFPIPAVLSAPIDRAIFKDDAGAADADDGGQLDLVLSAPLEKFLQHVRRSTALSRFVVLIAVPPKL